MSASNTFDDTIENGFEIVHDEIEVTNATLAKFSGVFSAINSTLAVQTNLLGEMLRLNTEAFDYQKRQDQLKSVGDSQHAPAQPAATPTNPVVAVPDNKKGFDFGNFGETWLANALGGMGLAGAAGAFARGAPKLLLRGGLALLLHDIAGDFVNDYLTTVLSENTDWSEEDIKKIAETSGKVTERGIIGGALAGRYGAIVGALSVGTEKLTNWALDQAGITEEQINGLIPDNWEAMGLDAEVAKTIGSVGITAIATSAFTKFAPLIGKQVVGVAARGIAAAFGSPILIAAIAGIGAYKAKQFIDGWMERRQAQLSDDLDAQIGNVAPTAQGEGVGVVGGIIRSVNPFAAPAEDVSTWIADKAGTVGTAWDAAQDWNPFTTERAANAEEEIADVKNFMRRDMGIDPENPNIAGHNLTDIKRLRGIFKMLGDEQTATILDNAIKHQEQVNQLLSRRQILKNSVEMTSGGAALDPTINANYARQLGEVESRLREMGVDLSTISATGAQPQAVIPIADFAPTASAAGGVAAVSEQAQALHAFSMQQLIAPTHVVNAPSVHGGTKSTNITTVHHHYGPRVGSEYGGFVQD